MNIIQQKMTIFRVTDRILDAILLFISAQAAIMSLRIYHTKQDNHQSLNDKLEGEWKLKFPLGIRHAKLEDINRRYLKLVKKPILFIKTLVNFSRFSYHADMSMLKSLKDINKLHLKIFVVLLYPIAILIAWQDKL